MYNIMNKIDNVKRIKIPSDEMYNFILSPDDSVLASLRYEENGSTIIDLFDFKNSVDANELQKIRSYEYSDFITKILFHPTKYYIILLCDIGFGTTIKFINIETEQTTTLYENLNCKNYTFSTTGTYLIGSDENNIEIYTMPDIIESDDVVIQDDSINVKHIIESDDDVTQYDEKIVVEI